MAININGISPYIQVFDMPASLKFYRDILGFSLINSSGEGDDVDWVMLQLADAILMLNTIYEKERRPTEPDSTRAIGHADVTLYFECPDVDELHSYLLNNGINVPTPQITHYGFKAISISDPDGYRLCFHWPVAK